MPRDFPGLGFDPTPGDPVTLALAARRTGALGTALADDGAAVAGLNGSGWDGDAGTAFRDRLSLLHRDLQTARSASDEAAEALAGYAQTVAALQRRRNELESRAVELRGRAREGSIAAAVAADLADVLRAARQLSGDQDVAARATASRLHTVAANRPYGPPSWRERLRGWITDHADGLRRLSSLLNKVTMVTSVLGFVPVIGPAFLAIDAVASVASTLIDAGLGMSAGGVGWAALGLGLLAVALPAAKPLLSAARGLRAARGVDPLAAAADRTVDVGRITPAPVWRTDRALLYRSDRRSPEEIFEVGFHPKNPANGDLEKFTTTVAPSMFVSTSRSRAWTTGRVLHWRGKHFYEIDAPGGIDVTRTTVNPALRELEVAFPGGIAREFIVGARPVAKNGEVGDLIPNPHYRGPAG